MGTRRIDIPAWFEEPNVYTMMITDQLKLNGADACEPDKIAETTMAVSWPVERGSYEIMKLDDPKFREAVDAAARKLALDLDARRFQVSVADYASGCIAVVDTGPECPECGKPQPLESFRCTRPHMRDAKLKAFYFVRVAIVTPAEQPASQETP